METVRLDIKMAKKFLKTDSMSQIFQTYCGNFLFTTENQEEISKIIDFRNKDVATVASSGDQYVSHIYYGANVVDVFDVSRFTYYITCLKVASILVLTYEEFLAFFVPAQDGVNKYFWNIETLKKLLKVLPNDAVLFLEEVLFWGKKLGYGSFIKPDSEKVRKDNVFRGMPFYYNEMEYYRLQMILRTRVNKYPRFTESNILEFGKKMNGKYDVIYLSNIIECLVWEELSDVYEYGYVNENNVEKYFTKLIMIQVEKVAKKNATILVDYRANRNLGECVDFLFDNDYFSKTVVNPKYYVREDSDNSDLVLTYKYSNRNKFWR